jgi:Na+/melibiose symporter-like transporter
MLRAFKNRAFRPLLAAWALEGLGLSSLLTMAPFFVRYVVESDGPAAVAARQAVDPTACLGAGVMCLLVVAMSCAPAWLAASRRWGKFRVWLVVSGAALACNVLFLIPLREWEGERGGRGVWL